MRQASCFEGLAQIPGTPIERQYALDADERLFAERERLCARKQGEVVLFILRPNGKLLLHAKSFYPAGVLRVPTGGIERGERICDALWREVEEETGLQVEPVRFLAALTFTFRRGGKEVRWPSYLFLLRETGGQLAPQDLGEQITAFREIAPCELDAVADQLEQLPADWSAWGHFRAIPHRVAAELLCKGECAN